jgi:tetratricopeptide (TPR) repeat protein
MYQALASLGQTPRDTARALYDEGSSAYDAGNYILAERKFREAYDTMPNAVVLTAIARSVEAQGRTYEAYQLYERYLAQEPEGSAAQRARDGMERTRPPKLPSTTVPATSSKPVSKPLPAPSVDKPAATLEQAEQEGKGASIAVWVVTGAGVLGLLGLGYLLTRPTKRPVAANRRRRRRRRRRR